jgi:type IV pilus assembly protein PilW
MIALVIGLLATGAMLKVYVDSSQLYRFNEGLARIQENGRFGLEFIRRDVRVAGFWGCYRDADLTNRISTGSTNYIDFDAGDITGTNGLEHNEPDSITFSGAGRNVGTLSSNMATPDSVLNVDSTGDFEIGDAVLISDCETADIFLVTGTAGTAPNLTLKHGTEDNTTDELSKAYTSGSRLYPARQITFCIVPGADPEQPSLRRLTNPSSGQTCTTHGDELVEGIENMQILMGEDTDADFEGAGGDGTANRYVRPETSNLHVDRIVSVRISLLTISPENNVTTAPVPYFLNEQEITPSDKYLRKVFTTTITLRNKNRKGTGVAKTPSGTLYGTLWGNLSAAERECGIDDESHAAHERGECQFPVCWSGKWDTGQWQVGWSGYQRKLSKHPSADDWSIDDGTVLSAPVAVSVVLPDDEFIRPGTRIRAERCSLGDENWCTRGCIGGNSGEGGADASGGPGTGNNCSNQICE